MISGRLPDMKDQRFDCVTYVIGTAGIDWVLSQLAKGEGGACDMGDFMPSELLDDDIREVLEDEGVLFGLEWEIREKNVVMLLNHKAAFCFFECAIHGYLLYSETGSEEPSLRNDLNKYCERYQINTDEVLSDPYVEDVVGTFPHGGDRRIFLYFDENCIELVPRSQAKIVRIVECNSNKYYSLWEKDVKLENEKMSKELFEEILK